MRRWWVVLALGIAVLAVPTNQSAVFDGLPWTSPVELLGIGIIVAISSIDVFRGAFQARFAVLSTKKFRYMCVVAMVLGCLKLFVFFTNPTTGEFEVCYRSVAIKEPTSCLATFEPHPLLAGVSERFDRRSTSIAEVDFGPRHSQAAGLSDSNWRLPFVNTDAYNVGYWPWKDADRYVQFLPFRAEFRGLVEGGTERDLVVRYVGEGTLRIDGKPFDLKAAYVEPSETRVPLTSSRVDIDVDFSFLRTQLNGGESMLPFAVLRLSTVNAGNEAPLHAVQGLGSKTLNAVTDASTVVFLLSLIFFVWSRKRELIWFVVGAVGTIGLSWSSVRTGLQSLVPIEFGVLGLVLLAVWLLLRKESSVLALGSLLVVSWDLVSQELKAYSGNVPRLSEIVVRLRGNDHLVYDSLSREMLVSGFLRGAESVYYFQPGIRYYFHLQGVLFGDSGALTGFVSVAVMGIGILFFVFRLRAGKSIVLRALHCLALAVLIVWWSSSHTTQSTILGLSEFYTWIAILLIGGVSLRLTKNHQLVVVSVLAASAVFVRPNQGAAMLVVALLPAIAGSNEVRAVLTKSAISLTSFFGVLLLIPIHNVVYGRSLEFEPRGAGTATQLSWHQLANLFSDPQARRFLEENVRGILYLPSFLPSVYSSRLAAAFLGFWVIIVILLLRAWPRVLRHRRFFGWTKGYWFLAAGAQVLPFMKFTVIRYFPIHIVAIHLTALVVALQLSSDSSADSSERGLVESGEAVAHQDTLALQDEQASSTGRR